MAPRLTIADDGEHEFVIDLLTMHGINTDYVLKLIELYRASESSFVAVMDLVDTLVEELDRGKAAQA